MTEPQGPQPEGNKDQPTPPPAGLAKEKTTVEENDKNSKAAAHAGGDKNNKTAHMLRPHKKKWHEIAAHPAAQNIIGAIVGIGTLGLLIATYYILRANRDAVTVANKALEDTRASSHSSDSSTAANYALSKRAFDSTISENRKRDSLDGASLEAQINGMKNALSESKREFGVLNQPYLEIQKFHIDSLQIGRISRVSFKIENLGNYPAKILDYEAGMIKSDQNPTFKDVMAIYHGSIQLLNKYVIKANPVEADLSDTLPLSKERFLLVTQNRQPLYFVGFLRYEDLITKHTMLYKFRIVADCKEGSWGQFLVNDNSEISDREFKSLVPNW